MRHAIFVLPLIVLACHDDPPIAPVVAASAVPTPALASAPAPALPGEKTPESCAAAVASKPAFAACKWTVEKRNCVCNGCAADGDCSAKSGGTCTTLAASKGNFPSAKACLYPGDDCFGGAACPTKGRACNHDGMGKSTTCSPQGDFQPK